MDDENARLRAYLARVTAERARYRADLADSCRVNERLSDLLTGVANALRGEPEPLHAHSWHDLPERARAVVAELDRLQAPLDTGNLADDPLYAAMDELYARGWKDRHKERDYDPRGTLQWQAVLDLFRARDTAEGEG